MAGNSACVLNIGRSLTWAWIHVCLLVSLCSAARTVQAVDCSQWSSWSACTKPCNTGERNRTRSCPDGHLGTSFESEACNTIQCEGMWSAWGDWSSCQTMCGSVERTRLRTCLPSRPGVESSHVACGDTGPYDFFQTESCGIPTTMPPATTDQGAVPLATMNLYTMSNSTTALEGDSALVRCCVDSLVQVDLNIGYQIVQPVTVVNSSRTTVLSVPNDIRVLFTPLHKEDGKSYNCFSDPTASVSIGQSSVVLKVDPRPSPTTPAMTTSPATSPEQTSPFPTTSAPETTFQGMGGGDKSGSSGSGATIGGAAAAAVVVFLLVVIIIILIVRRKKKGVKTMTLPIPNRDRIKVHSSKAMEASPRHQDLESGQLSTPRQQHLAPVEPSTPRHQGPESVNVRTPKHEDSESGQPATPQHQGTQPV